MNKKTILIVYIIVVSLITFVVYRHDKQAAEAKEWRVKELYLHSLSIAGGWPGAILGQEIFRHKTVKQPFRKMFLVTIIINLFLIWTIFQMAKHTKQ